MSKCLKLHVVKLSLLCVNMKIKFCFDDWCIKHGTGLLPWFVQRKSYWANRNHLKLCNIYWARVSQKKMYAELSIKELTVCLFVTLLLGHYKNIDILRRLGVASDFHRWLAQYSFLWLEHKVQYKVLVCLSMNYLTFQ